MQLPFRPARNTKSTMAPIPDSLGHFVTEHNCQSSATASTAPANVGSSPTINRTGKSRSNAATVINTWQPSCPSSIHGGNNSHWTELAQHRPKVILGRHSLNGHVETIAYGAKCGRDLLVVLDHKHQRLTAGMPQSSPAVWRRGTHVAQSVHISHFAPRAVPNCVPAGAQCALARAAVEVVQRSVRR